VKKIQSHWQPQQSQHQALKGRGVARELLLFPAYNFHPDLIPHLVSWFEMKKLLTLFKMFLANLGKNKVNCLKLKTKDRDIPNCPNIVNTDPNERW